MSAEHIVAWLNQLIVGSPDLTMSGDCECCEESHAHVPTQIKDSYSGINGSTLNALGFWSEGLVIQVTANPALWHTGSLKFKFKKIHSALIVI